MRGDGALPSVIKDPSELVTTSPGVSAASADRTTKIEELKERKIVGFC